MMETQEATSPLAGERGDPCAEIFYPRWASIRDALWKAGLFNQTDPPWLLSPFPFPLTQQDVQFFESLGQHLLAFYQATNQLYFESLRNTQPSWVHRYLDQGKPVDLVEFARMKRFRTLLPDVIRPDVIPTEEGMKITELDSVPGGIGITGCLSEIYATLGDSLIGGTDGMMKGFASMLQAQVKNQPGCIVVVVSDEAEGYRAEMTWVASQMKQYGLEVYCIHPRDLHFTEERLLLAGFGPEKPISLIYRFFELFDLKNIPKAELVMYTVKKGRGIVTPPYKPWMEEKLAFALLHHPILEPFWTKAMGPETFQLLCTLMPRTWVLDPDPLPPSAIIPNLRLDNHAVSDWKELGHASQRQRQYVVKPSGFSPLAWGSRGVSVGHDLSQSTWSEALDHALSSFSNTPYILQEFHKGKQYNLIYYDQETQECRTMAGRVRLSPYYFVRDQCATLAGILATVCQKDKKIIHGMRHAIIAPCTVTPS